MHEVTVFFNHMTGELVVSAPRSLTKPQLVEVLVSSGFPREFAELLELTPQQPEPQPPQNYNMN